MSYIDQIMEQLSGDTVNQIGRQLGVEPEVATKAIASALPVLFGGLARNADSTQGAQALTQALHRDHDGSQLEDLSGMIQAAGGTDAVGILGHLFGSRRAVAEQSVQKTSALDGGQVATLMRILAPIVMGYLGKRARADGMKAPDISRELRRESEHHGPANTSLGGMVTQMLDADGDGSAVDDVLSKIGSGLLRGWGK